MKNRKPLPLHRYCKEREKCWINVESRRGRYSGITLPHIGAYYDKTRTLVLGINNRMNEGRGSYDIEDTWIKKYARGIRNKEPMRTMVYKYASIYATIIMSVNKILPTAQRISNIDYDNKSHRKILAYNLKNYLAWTQVIKCNPLYTTNNVPYRSMWKYCPSLILCGEIEELKPRLILILGISDNLRSVIELLERDLHYSIKHIKTRRGKSRIEHFVGKNGKLSIDIISVSHPSSRYEKADIMERLKTVNL
jgi:hypothetical protein